MKDDGDTGSILNYAHMHANNSMIILFLYHTIAMHIRRGSFFVIDFPQEPRSEHGRKGNTPPL